MRPLPSPSSLQDVDLNFRKLAPKGGRTAEFCLSRDLPSFLEAGKGHGTGKKKSIFLVKATAYP